MMEAAVIVGLDGEPLYWHDPPGRTVASLPTSADLVHAMVRFRGQVAGIAHTHPGHGLPYPSGVDMATFIDFDLGRTRKLDWWIASADRLVLVKHVGPGPADYGIQEVQDSDQVSRWLTPLRTLSGM